MRIACISDVFPDPARGIGVWGGGERQFFELTRRYAKMGHEAIVITSRFPGQPGQEWVEGVWVRRCGMARDPRTGGAPKLPIGLVRYLTGARNATISARPDIIHCNSFFSVFPGRSASSALGVPLVTTFHDVWSARDASALFGSRLMGVAGYLTSLLSVKAAGTETIAVSEATRSKLKAWRAGGDVTVIPNGVDLDMLDATGQDRSGRRLLYVGRLVRGKRVDVLVRAFARVVQQRSDAELKIVGDGPERRRLVELATDLGLDAARIFTGTVPKYESVAELYKQSDLFVFPSISEGEGIVVKEAMAASLPVIAARCPGSAVLGLVNNGWNGRLVAPGDDAEFASSIAELLANPKERAVLAANGRKFVSESSWDSVADRTLEVYRKALASAGAPSSHRR